MSERQPPYGSRQATLLVDLLATIAYCRSLLPADADPAHEAALAEIERWLRRTDWQTFIHRS
jgi:hypothetical protein